MSHSSTHYIDTRTTTRPRNTSSAATYVHRLKRSRTSPHSSDPQPGTHSTASGADDAVDVSHRQELTSSSYCCCCEPEFDHALLLLTTESRHDALDSPNTPCIRVLSPLAWGRNNVRELHAEAARAGRWWPWLDSNGFTFFVQRYDRGTCCRLRTVRANCCCINTWYSSTWYVVRVSEVYDLFQLLCVLSCLLYTSPSPRDRQKSRMPSSA